MSRKFTMEDMHVLAEKFGGEFISNKYIDSSEKHTWRCSKMHTWEAAPKFIKQGYWCPHCAGNIKLTNKDMHILAEKFGGKFLSSKYIGARHKHTWQCTNNHIWDAKPNDVQQGKWCRKCYFNKKMLTVEDMHLIAESFGGRFLSSKYEGVNKKYVWQCSQEHIWETSYSTIRNGSRCPYCATFRSEEICRGIISKMFEDFFIKCRPDFLLNDKGRNLELDGYSEKLNLAFEYHGKQHFEPIDYYGGEKIFAEVKRRDRLKLDFCAKAGIRVIVVPTFPRDYDPLMCQAIIEQAVIVAGVEIPSAWIRAADLMFKAAHEERKALQIGG